MKHQWLAYVIVGLLAIGAGVAIAGLPNNVPVDATITPPTTTVTPEPTTEPAVTTTTEVTATTTTKPSTTNPAEVEPTDTTDPSAAETTDAALSIVVRSKISVIAANGADVAGAGSRMVRRLADIGYVDVRPRDGTQPVDFTTVFYADGFDDAAMRMAEDLELAPEFVAPISDAPNVLDLPDGVELLVYIGADRA